MDTAKQIKELRESTGMSRKDFSEHTGIPVRTLEDWEAARRTPPEYIPRLIAYQLKYEELIKNSANRIEFEAVKNKEGKNGKQIEQNDHFYPLNLRGVKNKTGPNTCANVNPMLVVTDIDKSVEFYKKVLGLHVIMDFGANKTLTGGLALQTLESWQEFIGTGDVLFGSNSSEVYFEEDNFDKFADKLKKCEVEYVHPIMEHSWGQRVVRIYDPDKHIIEIGENIKVVCKRFLDNGMTPEQIAERMDVPMKFVNACMR